MITTGQFKIKKSVELTSYYIEQSLLDIGIEPLRWAIVDFDDNFYFVEVSYEVG